MIALTRHFSLNENIPRINTLHGSKTYVLKTYTTCNDYYIWVAVIRFFLTVMVWSQEKFQSCNHHLESRTVY